MMIFGCSLIDFKSFKTEKVMETLLLINPPLSLIFQKIIIPGEKTISLKFVEYFSQ